MLEEVIRTLESSQVDPREKDQQPTDSVLKEAKDWLVQIQADDDEGAIRRISDFFDQR
jgi:hypothetical protein